MTDKIDLEHVIHGTNIEIPYESDTHIDSHPDDINLTSPKDFVEKIGFDPQIVLDNHPTIICIETLDHNIPYGNKMFKRIFGKPDGRKCYEIFYGAEKPCIKCKTKEVIETGIPSRRKWTSPNGKTFIIHEQKYPGPESNDKAISSWVDITNYSAMEKEYQKSQMMDALGHFAGGLAHDFNNLISMIMGSSQIMRFTEQVSQDMKNNLDRIDSACERAKDLTNQFRIFSAGGDPIRDKVDMYTLLMETLKIKPEQDIKYEINASGDELIAFADKKQISDTLSCIIENCHEALGNAGVIKISAKEYQNNSKGYDTYHLKPGKYIMISIEDNGPGILHKNLARVFDPYFSTKSKGKTKGTGFGLSIAYRIMKMHNGTIQIDSKERNGTKVDLFIPSYKEKAKSDSVSTYKAINKILLMDDEEMIRAIAKEMLKQLGYEIQTAPEGETAISLYSEAIEKGTPYDLVILDLAVNNGLGGIKTIQKLKEIDSEVTCIVSSGYSSDDAIVNYTRYGFKGSLPKPYKIEALDKIIKDIS